MMTMMEVGTLAQCSYYTILAAMLAGVVQFAVYKRNPKIAEMLITNIKYVFWAHGLMTFTFMWLLEPQNLLNLNLSAGSTAVLKYTLQSVLALTLWDFGHCWAMDWVSFALLNMHHVGLFVALHFGFSLPAESKGAVVSAVAAQQAHMDTCMFGYLWSIHSFGFFLEVIFPLIGIKLQEGQRSIALDGLKHVYCAGTVYVLYQYLNAESQPGLDFRHYQTFLLVMFAGRWFINGNWKNIDFLRRVELPGCFTVIVDHLFFHDVYLERAAAAYLTLVLGFLAYKVFFHKSRPKPTEYFGPEANPELKALLDDKTDEVLGLSLSGRKEKGQEERKEEGKEEDDAGDADGSEDEVDKNKKNAIRQFFVKIFDNEAGKKKGGRKPAKEAGTAPLLQKDAWPLHYAVARDDVDEARRLVTENPELINAQMSDWHNYTPLMWAIAFNNAEIAMLLLKNGANPYLTETYHGGDSVDVACDATSIRTFGAPGVKPGTLGSMENFFDAFETVVLKRSPPAFVWDQLPVAQRVLKVVEKW